MAIKPAGRGPELIAVYSFFIGLTTLAVALRTYCRVYLVKNFALDDWLCVTAWVRPIMRGTLLDVNTYALGIPHYLLLLRHKRCSSWNWPTCVGNPATE